MVTLQILNKVLSTHDYSLISDNQLDVTNFVGYEAEFNFIKEHYDRYGNVPDKATFLTKFTEFDLVDVAESDEYLVRTVREESLYRKAVPVVQKMAELLQTDANMATEYLLKELNSLQPDYGIGGTNIVTQADERLEQFKDRKNRQDDWFFSSGFPELDNVTHGIQRGEELYVIFARTNQGKSWILAKMCTQVWKTGYNVGYISPEMSANSIGYRFDTLYQNFSNRGLMWGNNVEEADYAEYIRTLDNHNNKFIVSTPQDFGRKITVSKLKSYIKQYDLDLVAIDGITYMTDERYKRGDSKTTSLTNISEDLISLSVEMKVPILVVVQSNRGGVVEGDSDDTPDLEHIRDSDGIAQNATKVISIRQKDNNLKIGIKKQRFGAVGGKLTYLWDIDQGVFEFVPDYEDAESKEKTESRVAQLRREFVDATDVF